MRRPKLILALAAATTALAVAAVHTAREVAGPPLPILPVAVPARPTTGPTPAVARATRPPTTLAVDGHDVEFPATSLTVAQTHRGLHALLSTDDPAEAIGPGYAGNSFMFDMRLPTSASATDLGGWDYTPGTSSTATGLFLNGSHEQLQPTAGVHVEFRRDGPDLVAVVSGPFVRLDDRDPAAPPQRVEVYGCVRCLSPDR